MANRVIGEIQRLFSRKIPKPRRIRVLCALNRYVRLTMAKTGVLPPRCAFASIPAPARCNLQRRSSTRVSPQVRRSIIRLSPTPISLVWSMADDYCPNCQTVAFHPGDALLAYTDAPPRRAISPRDVTISGLYDRFGQLTSSPERWPQALLHQITSHRRAPAEDDTLLAAIYRV